MRKFLTSVADVYAYDSNDALVFSSKTLVDSSIEVSLGSNPVRGGVGNQLQYVYYHTGEMNITLTDTQWNLAMLAKTVGQGVQTGSDVYVEENIQLTVGGTITGTVSTYTPKVFDGGSTIYGWLETADGFIYRGTFTGSNFTSDGAPDAQDTVATSDYGCIRFYAANADATYLTIPASILPSVLKLVIEAQLNSADVSSNKIGVVQIIVPEALLSGAFSITMAADGVSQTPLTAQALAHSGASDTPCVSGSYYARIIEIIDSANWYDDIIGITAAGGDISMANSATYTPTIWAIPRDPAKASFVAPAADLSFTITEDTSSALVSVGLHTGLITAHGTNDGTAFIGVTIDNKPSIDTTLTVVVA